MQHLLARNENAVAVTGATGLVGARLCRQLDAAGHAYVTLGRRAPTQSSAAPHREWCVDSTIEQTAAALSDTSSVCHIAALVPDNTSDSSLSEALWQANALATQRLIAAAEIAGVQHFTYVSGANLYAVSDRPVTERSAMYPTVAPYYLSSKLVGELFVAACTTLSTCIVRPTSIYGIGMSRGVVKTFVDNLLAGEPLSVNADEYQRSDLVWADDVADVLAKVSINRLCGDVIVGSGETTSIKALASLAVEATSAPDHLVNYVEPESPLGRPVFPAVSIAHAREWLGFEPTPLRIGLAAYVAHLKRLRA